MSPDDALIVLNVTFELFLKLSVTEDGLPAETVLTIKHFTV